MEPINNHYNSHGQSLLLVLLPAATGTRLLQNIQLPAQSTQYPILHADKIIVCSSSQYVVILSLKTGEVLSYLQKEGKNIPIRYVKLSSSKIYAAFEDGEIVVWDLHSREIVASFDLHKSTVSSIALSEDEVRMVSAGFDGQIIIWDLLSEEHQIMYQCRELVSLHTATLSRRWNT